jgi:hypothetical protein
VSQSVSQFVSEVVSETVPPLSSEPTARHPAVAWLRRQARPVRRVAHAVTPAAVAEALAYAEYARARFATRNPKTFNDKIHYKMFRDHRPLLTTFADKVAVRDYVTRVIGPQVLPHLIAVTDDPSELRGLDLPANYALKASHASGGVVLVSDTAPAEARLPHEDTYWPRVAVRPENIDPDHLERLCGAWLGRLYGGGRYREWAYVDVPHRIVIEELLRDRDGGIPIDYKLFVFNGRCRLVQVDSSRYDEHRQNFFRTDWTKVAVELAAPPAAITPVQPAALAEMVAMAERLGVDTDLVRVDLYDVDGRVVFGELTSYVLGGQYRFRPAEFETEVGSWWTVPRRYV